MAKGGVCRVERLAFRFRVVLAEGLVDGREVKALLAELLALGLAEAELPTEQHVSTWKGSADFADIAADFKRRVYRELGRDRPAGWTAEAAAARLTEDELLGLETVLLDAHARLDGLRLQPEAHGKFAAVSGRLLSVLRLSERRRVNGRRLDLQVEAATGRATARAAAAQAAGDADAGDADADAAGAEVGPAALTAAAIRAEVQAVIHYEPTAQWVEEALAAYAPLAATLAEQEATVRRRSQGGRLERPLTAAEVAALSCYSCRRAAARLLGVEEDTDWLCRDQSAYLDVLVGVSRAHTGFATGSEERAALAGAPFVQLDFDPLVNGPNVRVLQPGLRLVPADAADAADAVDAAAGLRLVPADADAADAADAVDAAAGLRLVPADAADADAADADAAEAVPGLGDAVSGDDAAAGPGGYAAGLGGYTAGPGGYRASDGERAPTREAIRAAAAGDGALERLLQEAYTPSPGAREPRAPAPGEVMARTWGCAICTAHADLLGATESFHGLPGERIWEWYMNGPVYDAQGWMPAPTERPGEWTGLSQHKWLRDCHAAAAAAGLPCGPRSPAELQAAPEGGAADAG